MHDGEFVALADIGAAGDDFAAVVMLLEPRNDDGGIETAGIGQNDFFDFVCHEKNLSSLLEIQSPIVSAMIAFCVCSRFSASSKMTSALASKTSSVISSPR